MELNENLGHYGVQEAPQEILWITKTEDGMMKLGETWRIDGNDGMVMDAVKLEGTTQDVSDHKKNEQKKDNKTGGAGRQ